MFALHLKHRPSRRLGRLLSVAGIAIVVLAFAASYSMAFAQQGDKTSFGESPVDALASKIKVELQTAKAARPQPSETPSTTDDQFALNQTSKPAKPGVPVTSSKVKAFEAAAMRCQAAEESLILYKIFLANPATTEEEKQQAQARYEHWNQAAADELVRVGLKWMPKDEAAVLEKQADELVRDAAEMLDVENLTGATTKLEKASKIYPEHLDSTFLQAVTAYLRRDFKVAATKFEQCVNRAPNNIALLNNIAICEVQLKRNPSAIKHWEQAVALDLENALVAQNLGHFVSEASQKRAGNVDKKTLADVTETYQTMITKDPGIRTDPSRGYVIARTLHPTTNTEPPPKESGVVGTGTGFVIAQGLVLTNRHVVDQADGFAIENPGKTPGLPHFAKVVAVSKELDLALLECPSLKTAAVPIGTTPVSRGTEAMAFAFPNASIVDKALKATRVSITGLPSEATDKMLALDIELPLGSRGGPLCDRGGRVVGIASAKTFKAALLDTYGMATPINDALPFIKQNVPDYAPAKVETKTDDWTEVDALISQSTVMILVQKKQ